MVHHRAAFKAATRDDARRVAFPGVLCDSTMHARMSCPPHSREHGDQPLHADTRTNLVRDPCSRPLVQVRTAATPVLWVNQTEEPRVCHVVITAQGVTSSSAILLGHELASAVRLSYSKATHGGLRAQSSPFCDCASGLSSSGMCRTNTPLRRSTGFGPVTKVP